MRCCVCLLTPPEYPYAHLQADMCRLLCGAIREAGHECVIQRQPEMGSLNLVVGTHVHTRAQALQSLQACGRYVLVQTELVTMTGSQPALNGGRPQHFAKAHGPYMRHAAAVWTGLRENVEALASLGISARLFEGGYVAALEGAIRPRERRDVEVLFAGTVTPHRSRQFARLLELGIRVKHAYGAIHVVRDDLISRALVHAAPVHGPHWPHFAWTRVCHLLHQGALVVAERASGQERWERCMVVADSESWPATVAATLRRPDREEVAAACVEEFRRLPMAPRMAELLRELE